MTYCTETDFVMICVIVVVCVTSTIATAFALAPALATADTHVKHKSVHCQYTLYLTDLTYDGRRSSQCRALFAGLVYSLACIILCIDVYELYECCRSEYSCLILSTFVHCCPVSAAFLRHYS